MASQLRVSTSELNLRAAPGTGAQVLAVLTEGSILAAASNAPVTLDDRSTWLNVTISSGMSGWVHAGFVTVVEPARRVTYRVATDALNLRAGPGVAFEILEVTHDGEILAAVGPAGPADAAPGWLNVATESGKIGWVSAAFVSKVPTDDGSDSGTSLAWGAKVSPAFCDRVREVARHLACDPDFLMAAIAFETGRAFTASVRNQWSGATGLIQFMPATAISLGTTVDALAAMTPVEQLTHVERYLEPYSGRIRTIEDLYMAILWPAAVGEPNDYALFRRGTIQYTQNAGLDTNGDGIVTKQEAARPVIDHLAEGRQSGNRE